jgi:osmotically-inducible protein OsmY
MRISRQQRHVCLCYACLCVSAILSSCQHDLASEQRDEIVTRLVKQAFIEDKANLLEVDVETHHGTVYLTGEVRDQDRKLQAEKVTRRIRGVKEIFNKIALEP